MHNYDYLPAALEVYAQTNGNIAKTYRILKQRGYVLCEGTVRNWVKGNRRLFEKAKNEHWERIARYSAQKNSFLEIELEDLLKYKNKAQTRADKILEAGKATIYEITQLNNSMRKLADGVVKIYQLLESKDLEDSAAIKALKKILFRHKAVGPIIREHWNSIKADVMKEMKKQKRKKA
jgi:hypothetical protein